MATKAPVLGDYCGGFQGTAEQTDTEKAEEKEANLKLPDLTKKWSATFAEFRELRDALGKIDRGAKCRPCARKWNRLAARSSSFRRYRVTTGHSRKLMDTSGLFLQERGEEMNQRHRGKEKAKGFRDGIKPPRDSSAN